MLLIVNAVKDEGKLIGAYIPATRTGAVESVFMPILSILKNCDSQEFVKVAIILNNVGRIYVKMNTGKYMTPIL